MLQLIGGDVGAPVDADPTGEVKRRQREFFIAIYQLTCGSDTGPRLPTLSLSIGFDCVRKLLAPPARNDGAVSGRQ